MQNMNTLGIFSIVYFFSLILIFSLSRVENHFLLFASVLLYVETIVVFSVYYAYKNHTPLKSIAILLSMSFLTYFIHLLVTLPFSLLFIADNLTYAGLQKSTLIVIRILISLQFYMLISISLYFLLKKEKIKYLKSFIFFGIILFISFVIPVQLFKVKVIYFLNSFLPMFFILFILAHLLVLNKSINIKSKIFPYLMTSLLLTATWMIIGYTYGMVLYFDKWEFFDVRTFYSLKGYEPLDGLPRSWWATYGDFRFFRFPSLLENPITTAYFSAFLSMSMLALHRYFLSLFFFIFTIISVSKGAILYLTLAFLVFISSRVSSSIRIILSQIFNSYIILTLLLITYIGLQIIVSEIFKSSASIHILGLTLPFINIEQYSIVELLFGHGIGSGGNFFKSAIGSSNIDFTTWLSSGSESGIGTIFYQLGIFGFGCILWINYKIMFLLHKIESKFVYFFYFLNMFLQEDLINFNLLILMLLTVLTIEFHQSSFKIKYLHRS